MTGIYLAIAGLALVWAIQGAAWRVLVRKEVLSSVLGGIVVLGIAWNVKAVLPGMSAEALVGLSFQFFGAALLVAMYGLRPAILMLALVTVLVALLSGWTLEAALRQYLVLGLIPALVAQGVNHLIQRFLPKHMFIFILGRGYVAGVMSVIIPAIFLFTTHQAFSPKELGLSNDIVDWVVTLVILSFTEGSLTGMVLAVFVVYKPHWVVCLNDTEYLQGISEPRKMP